MNNELFKIDVKQTGKQVELRWIPVAELSAHPKNPRIGRPDKVDSIIESMRSDGYRPEKPMLVRPYESGYQIIGGHSRYLAAQESGIDQVFCAIEVMDNDEAILRMGSDNINDPFPWFSVCLYVVQNSVKDSKKGLSRTQLIRAATGKDGNAATKEGQLRGTAGEVLNFLMGQSADISILLDPENNRTYHLAEIHAASIGLPLSSLRLLATTARPLSSNFRRSNCDCVQPCASHALTCLTFSRKTTRVGTRPVLLYSDSHQSNN